MAVTGQNQDRLTACILRGLDISQLVADHERLLQVKPEIGSGLKQKPGLALAAIARSTIRPLPLFRMMRTDIKSIDPGACRGELLLYMFMQSMHVVKAVIAPGDTRLVSHDNDPIAALFELFYRPGDTGDKGKVLNPVEVVLLLVDRAVAIEKNRRPLCDAMHHGVHPSHNKGPEGNSGSEAE